MKVKFKKQFFIISFILLSTQIKAQLIYNNTNTLDAIGKSLEYYIDSSKHATIYNIKTNPFKKSLHSIPNFGLVDYPLWIKLSITNKSNSPDLKLEFSQSLLDEIKFYSPVKNAYTENISGELYPFNHRLNNYHKYIYNLKISHDSTLTYFICIKSSKEIILPIFFGTTEEIVTSNMYKNLLFGIFFGVIIVMFFYNLFIYFTVKDSIYIYYVIYIIILGLTQATVEGYTFQFIWPNNNYLSVRAFFFFTAFVNITGIEFVRKFLNIKETIPAFNKTFFALYIIYIFAIILTVLGYYHIAYLLLQNFAGVVSIFILTVAILVAFKGYRPAKFFIIAWIPLIIGIIIYVLRDFNILPYTVITNYSITFSSALEVILLSFALADKINIYKKEKEESQAEVVKALEENTHLIINQNIMLEAKVTERTVELQASNKELNKTLVDLKEAESQLVEAEKMASLGQLTAGIAHEINNPINFVTSNIAPLKRDIDVLIDTITTIEEVGLSEDSIEEKQNKIEEYKEEIDFDYLKTEIGHLLKGIHEGASRTAEIVKGLRVFSRLDEDDLKIADINEGLESTLIIANNLLNNKIELVKQYGDIPFIECYPGKLNQVFLNIISNAIYAIKKKYGDKAGGVLKITTCCDEKNVLIKIEDNGIGMDEITKKKIFEPFFTTKPVGEGTGLGMSITYNTIKKHNGQIYINSTLGSGTEFILELQLQME